MKTLINISWTIIGLQAMGFILVIIDKEFENQDIFGIVIAAFFALFTYQAQKELKNKREKSEK